MHGKRSLLRRSLKPLFIVLGLGAFVLQGGLPAFPQVLFSRASRVGAVIVYHDGLTEEQADRWGSPASRGLLLVEFLLEVRGLSFEQVVSDGVTEEKARTAMQHGARSSAY